MKLEKFVLTALFLMLSATVCAAQIKTKPVAATTAAQSVKSTPAYAEVLLRKTELLSELESLLVEYTEEYPKVKELRFETGLLQKELDKLLAMSTGDASKLSAALGKLMVRKCELNADLWALQLQFNDQHPDVKRAKRKVEIFEAAINDILQGK
jgi:predicted nuclease with TOPRIM domain